MYPRLVRPKNRFSALAALGVLLLMACAIAGCKKAGPAAGADATAFASAPPEMKAAWDGAVAALQTNDFTGAYLTFKELRSQPGLTPDQIAAIDARRKSINVQLSAAAEKGDTNAAQALAEIRTLSRSRGH
ncbi:MAG: hypothetical protein ACLQVX_20680 [Limisphaerales bacterium]